MYRFCKHCRHTGHFIHEEGHSCRKHDFFVNINYMDTLKKMMECKDCDLTFERVLGHARYASKISFEIDFDDTFHVMNSMGTHIKKGQGDKWEMRDYDSPLEVYDCFDVENTHVLCYRVLFDDFPVYKTTDVEEIKFFIRGLGLHKAKISEGNISDKFKKLKKGDIE